VSGDRAQIAWIEAGDRFLQLVAWLTVNAHPGRGAQGEKALDEVRHESLDVSKRGGGVHIALVDVHVVIVDKPFEKCLTRLVRLVVGDYLPA
jgi:hypothetical protein